MYHPMEDGVVKLLRVWLHECYRVFSDRLVQEGDGEGCGASSDDMKMAKDTQYVALRGESQTQFVRKLCQLGRFETKS